MGQYVLWICLLFFFNDTATTEIYTLSLHDALPISAFRQVEQEVDHPLQAQPVERLGQLRPDPLQRLHFGKQRIEDLRSEEHTSELQSRQYLVCRLLLEKKKTQ